MYSNIQLVVQPLCGFRTTVEQPVALCKQTLTQLSNRLKNQFKNRLNVYFMMQLVVQPVVQPV